MLDSGGGNDILAGQLGNDRLFGGLGRDTLIGGKGSDFLSGGAGQDTLFGGGGPDQFVFDTALNGNFDLIKDYSVAVDTIDLKHPFFMNVGPVGVLAAGAFFTGAAAHDASDRIIYNPTNGVLIYKILTVVPLVVRRTSPRSARISA